MVVEMVVKSGKSSPQNQIVDYSRIVIQSNFARNSLASTINTVSESNWIVAIKL